MFNRISQSSQQQSISTPRVDNTARGRVQHSINTFIHNIAAALQNSNGDDILCFCIPNPFSRKEGDNVLTGLQAQDEQGTATLEQQEDEPTTYHNSHSMPDLHSEEAPIQIPTPVRIHRSSSVPIEIPGANQQLSSSPDSMESFGSPNSNQTLTDNQEIRYYDRRADAMWERLQNRPQG